MKNFPSIKKSKDYRFVYNSGISKACGCLVMYKKENGLDHNRLGVSASKKVGNSVVRHTVLRKLREIFRLNNEKSVQGYDIVIVARNQAGNSDYHKMENDYLKLLSYHSLLK